MSFDAFTATLFADPNLSEPATYNGVPVRVIRRTVSADFRFGAHSGDYAFESTKIRSDAVTFRVRAADVPVPAEGDVITVGAETFTVQGAPTRMMRGHAWSVEAVPA